MAADLLVHLGGAGLGVLLSDDDIIMCGEGLRSLLWMHSMYPRQVIGGAVCFCGRSIRICAVQAH